LRSIVVVSRPVCQSVGLSVRKNISGTTRVIFTKLFLCMMMMMMMMMNGFVQRVINSPQTRMLPMSVARSFSDMFTIGRIACRREGAFFPNENALSAGKLGGWECTARAKYAIYDCFVLYLHFGLARFYGEQRCSEKVRSIAVPHFVKARWARKSPALSRWLPN